jgi:hypothetical protein
MAKQMYVFPSQPSPVLRMSLALLKRVDVFTSISFAFEFGDHPPCPLLAVPLDVFVREVTSPNVAHVLKPGFETVVGEEALLDHVFDLLDSLLHVQLGAMLVIHPILVSTPTSSGDGVTEVFLLVSLIHLAKVFAIPKVRKSLTDEV